MTTVEEGESPTEEIPVGNPEELTKNPTALKEAHEQMATMDVLVCGQCHSAFHFVEEFKEHKDTNNCIGKSPVRDSQSSSAIQQCVQDAVGAAVELQCIRDVRGKMRCDVDVFKAIMRKRCASLLQRLRGSRNSILDVFKDIWESPMLRHWMQLHVKC